MLRKGIIKKVAGDKAWVQVLSDAPADDITEQSGCTCSSCAGCHTRQDHFLVDLETEVQVGDIVELRMETFKLFMSATITFILPVVMLLWSLWLTRTFHNGIKKWGIILAFLAFSFLLAYIFDKINKAKVKVKKIFEKDQTDE